MEEMEMVRVVGKVEGDQVPMDLVFEMEMAKVFFLVVFWCHLVMVVFCCCLEVVVVEADGRVSMEMVILNPRDELELECEVGVGDAYRLEARGVEIAESSSLQMAHANQQNAILELS